MIAKTWRPCWVIRQPPSSRSTRPWEKIARFGIRAASRLVRSDQSLPHVARKAMSPDSCAATEALDHLVGAGEQRLRGGDARPFCAVVARRGHEHARHEQQVPFEGPPVHRPDAASLNLHSPLQEARSPRVRDTACAKQPYFHCAAQNGRPLTAARLMTTYPPRSAAGAFSPK